MLLLAISPFSVVRGAVIYTALYSDITGSDYAQNLSIAYNVTDVVFTASLTPNATRTTRVLQYECVNQTDEYGVGALIYDTSSTDEIRWGYVTSGSFVAVHTESFTGGIDVDETIITIEVRDDTAYCYYNSTEIEPQLDLDNPVDRINVITSGGATTLDWTAGYVQVSIEDSMSSIMYTIIPIIAIGVLVGAVTSKKL